MLLLSVWSMCWGDSSRPQLRIAVLEITCTSQQARQQLTHAGCSAGHLQTRLEHLMPQEQNDLVLLYWGHWSMACAHANGRPLLM